MSIDLLSCIKIFIAVVDYKGFSTAARKLHLSTSHVTKQVKLLEESLGITLLNRTTRNLTVTESGETYILHARKIVKQLAEAKDALSNLEKDPHGELMVGMPSAFYCMFLNKQFRQFLEKYPKINLQIKGENSPNAIEDGLVDLVVSTINLNNKKLIKELFFTTRRGVFAAPDYIKKHGFPKKFLDLKKHNCLINNRVSPDHAWEFTPHKKIAVSGNYVSDSGMDIIFSGINGLGLIWTTSILVAEELMNGQLVEIPMEAQPAATNFYIYYQPAHHNSHVKLFVDYLLKVTKPYLKRLKHV